MILTRRRYGPQSKRREFVIFPLGIPPSVPSGHLPHKGGEGREPAAMGMSGMDGKAIGLVSLCPFAGEMSAMPTEGRERLPDSKAA